MLLKPFTQEVTTMNARPRKEIDTSTYVGRFAARLKMLREKAGLSPEDAAEQLKVPKKSIYNWEAGISIAPLRMFPLIAEVYGVKTRTLLPEK